MENSPVDAFISAYDWADENGLAWEFVFSFFREIKQDRLNTDSVLTQSISNALYEWDL